MPPANESGTQEISLLGCSRSRWEDWKVPPQARTPVPTLGLAGRCAEEQPAELQAPCFSRSRRVDAWVDPQNLP